MISRSLFKSKIHRATVTDANVDYEGSVTVDEDLLDAADIAPFEEVHVWNVTRGTRLATYAMAGARGSGVVCVNGAAAHLCRPGDLVILATFAQFAASDVRGHRPRIVRVDERNHVLGLQPEIAGPER